MPEVKSLHNGFICVNQDKLNRVVYGSVGNAGKLYGGLIEQYGEADKIPSELILAHYDRMGGYITKDERKIKNGSFWDYERQKPREKPEVVYIVSAVEEDGQGGVSIKKVEVKEGDPLPLELKKGKEKKKPGRPKKPGKSSAGETLEG